MPRREGFRLLSPEEAGKGPYWYVRGKEGGIKLNHSTKATQRREAQEKLTTWRDQIKRGKHPKQKLNQPAPKPVVTFGDAALAYYKAGGEWKHLEAINDMTGPFALSDKLLTEIDQIAIDQAAAALYPFGTAQTRNRQFYTPVSAVLKRAGVKTQILRPKGWRGNKSTSWLDPDQARALLAAADSLDAEFGLLVRTLLFTGMRLGEALKAELRHLDIGRATLYLPTTKNGEARPVHLPPPLVAAFANQPPRPGRASVCGRLGVAETKGRGRNDAGVPFLKRRPESRIFRFHAGGHLRDLLKEAMKRAGLKFPRRQGGFHLLRHTWASGMRRYAGLDTSGLVATGAWKSHQSVYRYEHLDTSEEARRADLLPWERKMGQDR